MAPFVHFDPAMLTGFKLWLCTMQWYGYRFREGEIARVYRLGGADLAAAEFYELLQSESWKQRWSRQAWLQDLQRQVEAVDQSGSRLISYFDKDYPFLLRFMSRPPLSLHIIGESAWRLFQPLTVVGSRTPSQTAIEWMEIELFQLLKGTDLILASGGARGIDQKAHQLCRRSGRPTLVFLPSGLGAPYPSTWRRDMKSVVADGGAMVSCFKPDQPMFKNQFHIRNALLAGVSAMTLIVEAKRRSGTLITAKWAAELDREVGVVPMSPFSGAGGLDLLKSGARLVTDWTDLKAVFEQMPKLSDLAIAPEHHAEKDKVSRPDRRTNR